MKIGYHLAVLSMGALLLSQASAQTTWTGTVDGDWTNTANWVGGTVGNLEVSETLTIQGGGNAPTLNVPTYTSQKIGTALFNLEAGASFSIDWQNGDVDGPVKAGDIVTIASGAELTWNNLNLPRMRFARDPANITQNYNINGGTFNVSGFSEVRMGQDASRHSVWTLDGGTVNFTGATSLWGSGGTTGDFSSSFNTISLDNGSVFNASGAALQATMSTGGDRTLQIDLLDVGSSFTAELGSDFVNITAVEAAFGDIFISSTLGDANLQAVQDGSAFIVTVAAIPEPATTALIIGASLLGLVAYKRRRA